MTAIIRSADIKKKDAVHDIEHPEEMSQNLKTLGLINLKIRLWHKRHIDC
jgi:hypothetical protein